MRKSKTIFDSLHLLKFISYELYWLSLGIFIFILGEAMILYFHEPQFLVPQIFFCIILGTIPLLYKLYFLNFQTVTQNINVLFEIDNTVWEEWLFTEQKNIFTLRSRFSKIIIFLGPALVFYTLAYLQMPFKSIPLIVFSIIALFILTLFCSITLQFTIMLLLFLRKLTFLKTVARFYLFPHPELTKLNRYFSSLSIIVSIGYIALVFAVWFSPYGFNFQMLIWLSVLALYPLTLFVWSFFHIHLIQHNVKFSFISLINEQVNEILSYTLKNKDSENLERLDRFMTIQSKLHDLKEYPFELSGLLTFIATTIITFIQVYIAYRNK